MYPNLPFIPVLPPVSTIPNIPRGSSTWPRLDELVYYLGTWLHWYIPEIIIVPLDSYTIYTNFRDVYNFREIEMDVYSHFFNVPNQTDDMFMIPIRFVAYALQMQVDWYEAISKAHLHEEGTLDLIFFSNSSEAYKNEVKNTLSVTSVLHQNRIFIVIEDMENQYNLIGYWIEEFSTVVFFIMPR